MKASKTVFLLAVFLALTSPALAQENVSITLTGDYNEVVSDGSEITEGVYTDLEYPYIAMQDQNALEGILATSGFQQASHVNSGSMRVSLTKSVSRGRFILPANTGSSQDIEARENIFSQENFLSVSKPSFTRNIPGNQVITMISGFDGIDLVGGYVLDPGPSTTLKIDVLNTSSLQGTLNSQNTTVRITAE